MLNLYKDVVCLSPDLGNHSGKCILAMGGYAIRVSEGYSAFGCNLSCYVLTQRYDYLPSATLIGLNVISVCDTYQSPPCVQYAPLSI